MTIEVISPISAQQFVDALIDFGPDRGKIWGNSQLSHLQVHDIGQHTAEVTEGSQVLGGAWERLRYDWSDPSTIKLHTVDSNIWGNGSGWNYRIKEFEDASGIVITATVTRYPISKKGRVILILFGSIGRPLITRSFRQSVRAIEKRVML